MAKKRRKSESDIQRQFRNIWRTGVENSDVYRSLGNVDDRARRFQIADLRLREDNGLSDRDKRINSRINNASRTASRYVGNLRKANGISDLQASGYASSGRMSEYGSYQDRKFSYARRAGISG